MSRDLHESILDICKSAAAQRMLRPSVDTHQFSLEVKEYLAREEGLSFVGENTGNVRPTHDFGDALLEHVSCIWTISIAKKWHI